MVRRLLVIALHTSFGMLRTLCSFLRCRCIPSSPLSTAACKLTMGMIFVSQGLRPVTVLFMGRGLNRNGFLVVFLIIVSIAGLCLLASYCALLSYLCRGLPALVFAVMVLARSEPCSRPVSWGAGGRRGRSVADAGSSRPSASRFMLRGVATGLTGLPDMCSMLPTSPAQVTEAVRLGCRPPTMFHRLATAPTVPLSPATAACFAAVCITIVVVAITIITMTDGDVWARTPTMTSTDGTWTVPFPYPAPSRPPPRVHRVNTPGPSRAPPPPGPPPDAGAGGKGAERRWLGKKGAFPTIVAIVVKKRNLRLAMPSMFVRDVASQFLVLKQPDFRRAEEGRTTLATATEIASPRLAMMAATLVMMMPMCCWVWVLTLIDGSGAAVTVVDDAPPLPLLPVLPSPPNACSARTPRI